MKLKGKKKKKGFKSPCLIKYDAFLDNALYKIRYFLSIFWKNLVILSRYLYPNSKKRFFIDLFDEFLTFGLLGLSIFTLSAFSILNSTQNDWKNRRNLSVTFLDKFDNKIGTRGSIHEASVPLSEIPDYVIKAILATEDRRFFDHIGIDFYGTSRAITQNMRASGVVQGGSTLTQQVAKNLFLSNERTISRKIKEAFLALWLESNFDKKEILQLYIDNAYMGGGTIGMPSAAKFYFGKDIRNISLAEAAILAGLFKAPTKYAPHINIENSKARTKIVLENLVNSGYMTANEVALAQNQMVHIIDNQNKKSPDYFIDWAYNEVQKLKDYIHDNKILVKTTLDSHLQKTADQIAHQYLDNYSRQYNVHQIALVTLDNDGSVRAMVGGRDYEKSRYNRASQGGRQAGSSFKPYVYAALMENGLTPKTMTVDAPINWGGWSPNNNNKGHFSGRIDIASALARSINTVPVRLVYQYLHGNTQPIRDLIKNMDIDAVISPHKTMILGTSNMTPLQQAIGFNVFANGGMAGNCHGLLRISNAEGKVLWDYQRDGKKLHRALSPEATAYMNQMLVQVPIRGSGKRAALSMSLVAGKTGTSQKHRDTWFVGYTGNYTTAVWMGNDNFTPTNRLFGGTLPALVFHDIMDKAHQNIKLKPLYGVENSILKDNENFTEQEEKQIPNVLSSKTTQIISTIKTELEKEKIINVKENINHPLQKVIMQ